MGLRHTGIWGKGPKALVFAWDRDLGAWRAFDEGSWPKDQCVLCAWLCIDRKDRQGAIGPQRREFSLCTEGQEGFPSGDI